MENIHAKTHLIRPQIITDKIFSKFQVNNLFKRALFIPQYLVSSTYASSQNLDWRKYIDSSIGDLKLALDGTPSHKHSLEAIVIYGDYSEHLINGFSMSSLDFLPPSTTIFMGEKNDCITEGNNLVLGLNSNYQWDLQK